MFPNIAKYLKSAWAPILALGLILSVAASATLAPVHADPNIEVVDYHATSEFPEGMRFSVSVESENDVEDISIVFRVGQNETSVYEYMEFDSAALVDSELFWSTDTRGNYIPPGTIITYHFRVTDVEGNEIESAPTEFIYSDARFEWDELTEGPVAVAYHGPVQSRAQIVLDTIIQTLDFMGPLLGADTETPIRVTMYNNVKEMLDALPPGSSTIRRELITEGQAYTNEGVLLVLGGGRGARGTASHEVTHILTHRAGDSILRRIPAWLDEGLAELGNVDPAFSYDIALEFAVGTDRLLPITSMPALPGDPEDVIIFYGQARSVVRYMIAAYGPAAMRELMATLKSGTNMDDAILEVYGVTRIELENDWRDAIGAPAFVPIDRDSAKPTPIPRRNVQIISLTPQAGSETLATLEDTPTPTPTPEPPTATPVPPTPAPTEPPAVAKTGAEPDDEPAESGSSGCGAPERASLGISDLAFPLFALGLVGMALRRRRK